MSAAVLWEMASVERSHWPIGFGVALSRAKCRSASGVARAIGEQPATIGRLVPL